MSGRPNLAVLLTCNHNFHCEGEMIAQRCTKGCERVPPTMSCESSTHPRELVRRSTIMLKLSSVREKGVSSAAQCNGRHMALD